MARTMSPNEIRSAGIEALAKSLGPTGMARFIQQFDKGSGDYTKERGQWLDQLSLEDITLAIEKIKKRKG